MTSGDDWGYGRPPEYEPYSPPPPSAPPPSYSPPPPSAPPPADAPPAGSPFPPPHSAYPPPGATPYTGPITTRSSVGVIGLALAVAGAVLGVVAFTALDWFDGDTRSHFADVHQVLKLLHVLRADNAIAYNYFSWLAWFLLGAAVVSAVLANVETVAVIAFRVMGAVLGAAGIVVTFLAIKLISTGSGLAQQPDAPRGYGDYLKHSRVAFYFALAAFLLTTIASLIGRPRPRPR